MVSFKAISQPPSVDKYPHAYRWYKHIGTYESEFSSLPGDPSKAYTTYGPEAGAAAVNPAKAPAADDDDIDLFGSDDEEEDVEAAKIREKNLAEYKAKKALKTKPAAKSIVTLDIKPWGQSPLTAEIPLHIQRTLTGSDMCADDETDLKALEAKVREIKKDGLVWAASKQVAVGFGIKKVQINLVVEDEKISIDDLQAEIEEDEEHVQSTDVVSLRRPYPGLAKKFTNDPSSRRPPCRNCRSDPRPPYLAECNSEASDVYDSCQKLNIS